MLRAALRSNTAQPMYNLISAAAAAGINRSTVLRAIKAGKISAQRDEAGGWQIDPGEFHRAFPPLPAAAQQPDAEVALLRNMLDQMRADHLRREEDLRQDRDRWHAAYEATQRLLPSPAQGVPASGEAGVSPLRRAWRRFWLQAG